MIKIFETQEELIILEKRDNPRPKAQEVSEVKWKLRSFQSKLKKEQIGEFLNRGRELIEKQINSQPASSSSMRHQASAGSNPMRRQLSNQRTQQSQQQHSSSESPIHSQQQEQSQVYLQVPPKNK